MTLVLILSTSLGVLEYRDVNLLAVTDVHSWVAGGDKQPVAGTPPASHSLTASFGDLVSFVERARAAARVAGKDIFLLDNGDVIDGTGLSNTANDHCSHLLPLLREVPFDALNCGNHELYDSATMEAMNSSGYISSWGGRYLTSNLLNATTSEPLGSRYTVMIGPTSGVRLLTFGFMYEMAEAEGRCAAIGVNSINSTVWSEWFVHALQTEAPDAIVVLAHMDALAAELTTVVAGIRAVLPTIPVQIIAGHSHVRQTAAIDGRAGVFEPGNFFNTVGRARRSSNQGGIRRNWDSNGRTRARRTSARRPRLPDQLAARLGTADASRLACAPSGLLPLICPRGPRALSASSMPTSTPTST